MPRTAKPFRLASRITEDCRRLLISLMARYGISEAAVVEQAVREYAEKRDVQAYQGRLDAAGQPIGE